MEIYFLTVGRLEDQDQGVSKVVFSERNKDVKMMLRFWPG
jgi:hypothetical protein